MDEIAKLVAGLSAKKRGILAKALGLEPNTSGPEPIAIVGMSCRFPGAPSLSGYWKLLSNGVDAITEIPADRWDGKAFYDPDPAAAGRMVTRWGGFLDQVDLFDADFFGISPREAQHMDPQQRLLLEVAWEAFEDAGQTVEGLAGSRTGVFVGCGRFDHALGAFSRLSELEGYDNTGNMLHAIPGRLAYLLNLRGPTMAIDTACSSSLVAIHTACLNLRQREADLALAGGVSVMLKPPLTIAISKAGALSSEGRCKTFDASADGYVRGEGCGAVVLKRLSDAVSAGDPIYAVIRGSATNHSGRSSGFTVPNVRAQQDVFRRALTSAGMEASEIGYLEAHGTATPLGDPIEMEAVMSVYGQGRGKGRPLVIGSAKTNFGHLEPAAGVAGLIKAALTLYHETIPPHLHFKRLNPNIAASEGFVIPTRAAPWPRGESARCAAVSSFGISGVNAHALLQEAPAQPPSEAAPTQDEALLLPLAARSQAALKAMAAAYREALATAGAPPLRDVLHTAANRRSHHDHRLAVAFGSREELLEKLGAFANDEARAGTSVGQRLESFEPRLAFVFCGQGPQWWGMGRSLLGRPGPFADVIERCDALFRELGGWSLVDELRADEGRSKLLQTEFAQPALFAVQAGLTAVWAQWGVEPEAVVGHSVGEIAAAYVCGALSLEEAVRVAFHRGRIMQRAGGRGRMAATGLKADEARALLEGHEGRVQIAAFNGPASTAIAGDAAAVEQLARELGERGVFARLLRGDFAFHSHHMDPFVDELARALGDIRSKPAQTTVFSTVTGQKHASRRAGDYDGAYWSRNMREPVLFAPAVERMIEDGLNVFIEIGPHPVLSVDIEQCLKQRGKKGAALPSLNREKDDRQTLLGSLGRVYTLGRALDWTKIAPKGRCVRLPTYAWQRERHWLPDQAPLAPAPRAASAPPQDQPSRGRALRAIANAAERRAELESYLVDVVGAALGYDGGRVGAKDTLLRLGVDSLIALRLKARLDADLELSVPIADLMKNVSLTALAAMLNVAMDGRTPIPDAGAATPRRDLQRFLVEAVAATLGYSPERVDPAASLLKLGIDSLMAFQLKSRVDAELGVSVPVTDFMKNVSLATVAASLEAAADRSA